ncbi:MAG: tetratricopeptide repeat protein [Phycisphaerae bacterium]|nr:tetratricopeptide repeat protein [Phycisphaerae bacterium]
MTDYRDELYEIEKQVNHLRRAGCYRDALALQHTYVHLARIHYGYEHQRTLDSLILLGYFHRRCGHYSACQSWYQQCLKIAIPVLGESHEIACLAFNNMGALKCRYGFYDEAVTQFQRAIKPALRRFGTTAVDGMHLSNLATAWRNKGNFDLAATLYQMLLWMQEQGFNTPNDNTAHTNFRFGELIMMCDPASSQAERLLTQACDSLEANTDRCHPDWTETLGTLIELRAISGDYSQLPLAQSMQSVLIEKIGEENPQTGHLLLNIGRVLLLANRLDEAESTLNQALCILGNTVGKHHIHYWAATTSLGRISLTRHNLLRAEALLRQSLQDMEAVLGDQHPWLAENIESLAECLLLKGDTTGSRIIHSKASRLKKLPTNIDDFARQMIKCNNEEKHIESVVISHAAELQAQEHHDDTAKVTAMETRAPSCSALGWNPEAIQAYEQAAYLRLEMSDDVGLAKNLRKQAELADLMTGQESRARHLREQADILDKKRDKS